MPTPVSISVLPAWITAETMADTRAVWEPVYDRPLSDDDIIEILVNTAGVLRVLFGLRVPHAAAHVVKPAPKRCQPHPGKRGPGR